MELMDYFRPAEPGQLVRAIPGVGLEVPIWILGSSLYGAQLAAALGTPYAFASHFAPAHLHDAIELYRTRYRPSPRWPEPYVMAGINVVAADSDEEAKFHLSSLQQMFVRLRRGGDGGPLPPPVEGYEESLEPLDRATLASTLACTMAGSPATVKAQLDSFVERTGVDEVIVAAQIFDHRARLRSYELTAEVRESMRR